MTRRPVTQRCFGKGLLGAASLVCLLGMGPATARAQLVLEISTDKDHYLVDEPLSVRIALRNVGDDDVWTHQLLNPELWYLIFEITAPGEEPHRYYPRGHGDIGWEGVQESVICLTPGREYAITAELTQELRRYPEATEARVAMVLAWPGEYVLRARYEIRDDFPVGPLKLPSNQLRLTVSAPEGRDRAAHDLILSAPEAEERGPWSIRDEEQAECYREVLSRFPQSAYAARSALSLASVTAWQGQSPFGELRGTPAGAAKLQAASEIYLRAAELAGDSPLGVNATRAAAQCLAKVGHIADTQALCERAFLLPAATLGQRRRILGLMRITQLRILQRDAGYGNPIHPLRIDVPLRPFAEAVGLRVEWDAASQAATVTGGKLRAFIRADQGLAIVNGERLGHEHHVSEHNGQFSVSPSLIEALIEARYGQPVRSPDT